MARSTVVETHDLTVRFGGVTALEKVDFSLGKKELRCLIGPNGAGKSTFFKCLTGMQRPTEGEIYIKGENVTGFNPHAIARLGIGIKTQVPSVMDGCTVRENIWLGTRRNNKGRRADQVTNQVIERVGLGDIAQTEVSSLAHGQRQMVELGIVLAGDPWLILLDEPAAGLTADEVDLMIDIIREMNERAAMVIVEHDMHFIRRIAETVTVFHQGKVLIEENVEAVLNDPVVRDVYLGKQR